MDFYTCKFYYFMADALLSKIENSTEIFNNVDNAANAANENIANSLQNLPQVLAESTDLVREMFEQMAKGSESKPTEAANDEAKPEPTVEAVAEQNEEIPTLVHAEITETKPENVADNDPVIKDENDDEEEEIITTTRPVRSRPEVEAVPPASAFEETKGESAPVEEDNSDEFKAPWENLEVAFAIFEKTKAMHENPEEFEQTYWNLKADILERQADLEISREFTKEGIEKYITLIEL